MANADSITRSRSLQSADEYALLTELDGRVGTVLAFHSACLAIIDGGNKADWRQQLEALQAVILASKTALKQIDEAVPNLMDMYQARLKATSMQVV